MLNSVSFTLPSCPPSVNSLYTVDWSARRIGLKVECRSFKTMAKERIPAFSIGERSILQVDRIYYYPWFCKDGSWRKRDSSNMDKLLLDAIAERTGIDDRRFKCGMMESRHADREHVEIVLTEVYAEEWAVEAGGGIMGNLELLGGQVR